MSDSPIDSVKENSGLFNSSRSKNFHNGSQSNESRPLSMTDLFNDSYAIRTAIINCTINLFALICLVVLYYNYVLLQPYFYALFWAFLVSIPLHSFKKSIVNLISSNSSNENNNSHERTSISSPSLFKITVIIIKIILKFLFGNYWYYITFIPRWYFKKIKDFENRQQILKRRRRNMSMSHSGEIIETNDLNIKETETLSKSLSSKDQNQNLRENKTSIIRSNLTPSMIIEKSIETEVFSSPSSIYFIYLFRSCGLYLIYLFVSSLSIVQWFMILGLIIIFTISHILLHTVRSLYIIYIHDYVYDAGHKVRVFVRSKLVRLDLVIGRRGSRLYQKIKNILYSSNRFYHVMKEDMRQETFKQINSIVAGLILFVFITSSIILTFFLAAQFFHEVNIMAEKTFAFVNQTVINNEKLKEYQFREKLETALNDATNKGIIWADVQLKEKFPGYNITVQSLYDKALQSYTFIFTDNHTTFSTVNPLFPDKYNTLLLTHFPVTSRLVKDAIAWNMSSLLQYNNLISAANELRSGLIVGVETFFQYDKEYIENVISTLESYLLSVGHMAMTNSALILSYISISVLTIMNLFIYGFNILAQLLLFFATLYYLLLPDEDPLSNISRLIVYVDPKQLLRASVEKAIKAVFITTIKMLVFHSLFTWLTFQIFQVQFVYIATVAAGLIAIIPITSPLWVVVPACLELYLKDQSLSAIILVGLHIAASWIVDSVIYCDIPDSHPYFSGLSIMLGIWAFGWHGIIIGPLLACLPVIVFHLYAEILSS